jgi:hypothetical protein
LLSSEDSCTQKPVFDKHSHRNKIFLKKKPGPCTTVCFVSAPGARLGHRPCSLIQTQTPTPTQTQPQTQTHTDTDNTDTRTGARAHTHTHTHTHTHESSKISNHSECPNQKVKFAKNSKICRILSLISPPKSVFLNCSQVGGGES